MGDPLGSFSPGRHKKFVRYTLVKSKDKADNIVVEVGGMLQRGALSAVLTFTTKKWFTFELSSIYIYIYIYIYAGSKKMCV